MLLILSEKKKSISNSYVVTKQPSLLNKEVWVLWISNKFITFWQHERVTLSKPLTIKYIIIFLSFLFLLRVITKVAVTRHLKTKSNVGFMTNLLFKFLWFIQITWHIYLLIS